MNNSYYQVSRPFNFLPPSGGMTYNQSVTFFLRNQSLADQVIRKKRKNGTAQEHGLSPGQAEKVFKLSSYCAPQTDGFLACAPVRA